MKRTLLISNSCFSDIESNGRTLKMLFKGVEKEKLAQFFTYGTPDISFCDNYYRVRDIDALRSMIPGKSINGAEIEKEIIVKQDSPNPAKEKQNKTPLKMCVRELVWKLGRWDNHYFWNWIDDFKPELIVVFVANNIFLIDIAIAVAKRCSIPIVVYTTEGYNFMDYNYFTWKPSVFYKLFYHKLSKSYYRLAKFVRSGFFNVPLLAEEYNEAYGYPCFTVMNSSDIEFIDKGETVNSHRIVYAGNLGLKRHVALIEIADALQNIDKNYKLDVYGGAPNTEIENDLSKHLGINYHGFVDYSVVRDAIKESTLLIHAEHSDAELDRYLKYAFSTKIADCISSGTPLLIYGNPNIACVKFCQQQECAFVVNNKEDLQRVLVNALNSIDSRRKVIDQAKKTVATWMTGNKFFLEELDR